jgi:hypothetical protein
MKWNFYPQKSGETVWKNTLPLLLFSAEYTE